MGKFVALTIQPSLPVDANASSPSNPVYTPNLTPFPEATKASPGSTTEQLGTLGGLGANSYLSIGTLSTSFSYADALSKFKSFHNDYFSTYAQIMPFLFPTTFVYSSTSYVNFASRDLEIQSSIVGILSAVERVSIAPFNARGIAVQQFDGAMQRYGDAVEVLSQQLIGVSYDEGVGLKDHAFSAGKMKPTGFVTGYQTVSAVYDLSTSLPGDYKSSNSSDIIYLSETTYRRIQPGLGNDTIVFRADGSSVTEFSNSGSDTYLFKGRGGTVVDLRNSTEVVIQHSSGQEYKLTDNLTKEVDVVINPFEVKLADIRVRFDEDGTAGQVYRLYQAAFDRAPDRPGLTHNIKLADQGLQLRGMADAFAGSAEFSSRYGANSTNETFVTTLYRNVLDRAPDQVGFSQWLQALNDGRSRGEILIGFSESQENHNLVGVSIQNGIILDLT